MSKGHGQRTFITKLIDHVLELEGKVKLTHSDRQEAIEVSAAIDQPVDGEFRTYHLAVVDLLEEDEIGEGAGRPGRP